LEQAEVGEDEVFGAGVLEFVGFAFFDCDTDAGGEGVVLAVDADHSVAGFDKEDFGHILMGMGGGNLAGGESGLGEVGEMGQITRTKHDSLFDGGVVGDGFFGEGLEVEVFHREGRKGKGERGKGMALMGSENCRREFLGLVQGEFRRVYR
jgi:hypothetical protein